MLCKDAGFRAFYKHFTIVPVMENTKGALAGFQGSEVANGILTYGYYDEEQGMMLEVMAAALVTKDGSRFGDPNPAIRSSIQISAVADAEFIYFSDKDGAILDMFREKVEPLKAYEPGEEMARIREMDFLDDNRDLTYIDNVLVILVKDGFDPDYVWVAITGLGENCFKGILLQEPKQDLGVHSGDQITFEANEHEIGRVVCHAIL